MPSVVFSDEYCRMVDREGKQVLLCTWSRRSPTLDFDFAFLEENSEKSSDEASIVCMYSEQLNCESLACLSNYEMYHIVSIQLVNIALSCQHSRCGFNPQVRCSCPLVYTLETQSLQIGTRHFSGKVKKTLRRRHSHPKFMIT